METEVMLTTFDNPFDPFEQFTPWRLFDLEKGYNTCEHLARIAQLTEGMTQQEENAEVERAIDIILENDFLNIYKKIIRDSEK